MRITIQTPADGTELAVTRELQRAFTVLHRADIQTRGGGRFADRALAIILARDADVIKALGALELAGVQALRS